MINILASFICLIHFKGDVIMTYTEISYIDYIRKIYRDKVRKVFLGAYRNARTPEERERLYKKYLETVKFINNKKLTNNHKMLR